MWHSVSCACEPHYFCYLSLPFSLAMLYLDHHHDYDDLALTGNRLGLVYGMVEGRKLEAVVFWSPLEKAVSKNENSK